MHQYAGVNIKPYSPPQGWVGDTMGWPDGGCMAFMPQGVGGSLQVSDSNWQILKFHIISCLWHGGGEAVSNQTAPGMGYFGGLETQISKSLPQAPVVAITWPWALLTIILLFLYSEKGPKPGDHGHRGLWSLHIFLQWGWWGYKLTPALKKPHNEKLICNILQKLLAFILRTSVKSWSFSTHSWPVNILQLSP